MKIAIIGAGISGLSSAYHLRKLSVEKKIDLKLCLYEKTERLGGVIDTTEYKGLLIEKGPDSILIRKKWGLDLIKELGLLNTVINTNDNNRRVFVYFNNRLNQLPDGFYMISPTKLIPFLLSSYFSFIGKIRILLEAIIPSKSVEDESLGSFVTRRFGREMLEKAAQPLISGIYSSDPNELSVRSTMPQFLQMEEENGSVIKSLLKSSTFKGKNQSGARYDQLITLDGGMSSLVEKLTDKINFDEINLNTEVVGLERENGKWIVMNSSKASSDFDGVVLSSPSFSSAKIIKGVNNELSDELLNFEYISSVVVVIVLDKSEIKLPQGFGVIVPSFENLKTVAFSIYSEKFPTRVKNNEVIIRCFLGGKINPEIIDMSDDEVMDVLRKELLIVFNFDKPIRNYFIKRYPNSMLQLKVGHKKKVENIVDLVSKYKGFGLCGSLFYGVGITDCIYSGKLEAERVLKDLCE